MDDEQESFSRDPPVGGAAHLRFGIAGQELGVTGAAGFPRAVQVLLAEDVNRRLPERSTPTLPTADFPKLATDFLPEWDVY